MAEEKKNKNLHATEASVKGQIVEKTKLQKAFELFMDEDIDMVKGSINGDFLKPRMLTFAKEMSVKFKTFIVDMGNEFLQSLLFPGSKRPRSGYYNGQSVNYTSYSGYYNSNGSGYNTQSSNIYQGNASSSQTKKIKFDSVGDAKKVIQDLVGYLALYPSVSVADYYQLAGVPQLINETDYNFGWSNLEAARVIYDSSIGGYIIDFPKVIPLE